eukprot:TRINITY_DN6170_c0_g1_i23.p6 TRINITY_DN6170_c0_g1~~TRINITY_DN6170_c0_g1_i23.p6  ORF type:complete len:120 (-),score=5.52 TRINITY_DN6170_c0_g1_i23:961-1320(-)
MASVINTVIQEDGCDSISAALVEMELQAITLDKVDVIRNMLYQFGPAEECMEQTVLPLVSMAQIDITRICAKNHDIWCDSSNMERRFLYDYSGSRCYQSHECKAQGFGTWKECNTNCHQ